MDFGVSRKPERTLRSCAWTYLRVMLALCLSFAAPTVATYAQDEGRGTAAAGQSLRPEARSRRFLGGRKVQLGGASALALASARRQHLAMLLKPRTSNLSPAWSSVGPGEVQTAQFGGVTGRVTALALDEADTSGNTLYVGTTGGGVWKSVNAAGPASAVSFVPLTDTLPVFDANAGTSAIASLSIGAIAVGNGIVLAGTGDPNDALDSFYGSGILRSADGGLTWSLSQGSMDGVAGNHSFLGLSVAGFAFSSLDPNLVVAAVSQAAEAVVVNAVDAKNSVRGLFYSNDAGATWHMATMMDAGQVVQSPVLTGRSGGGNAATAIVWNAVRQRFVAAIRFHGYYDSADGVTWTRLLFQPGAGLTSAACPPNPGTTGNPSCPIFRGALAVQGGTGDTFALTVDGANRDQGLFQDVCASTGANCANASLLFTHRLNATPLEVGSGDSTISQGDYSLTLNAAASGADTILYAGTLDLYRCSLLAGCSLRNTTNAQNGCLSPAGVAPSQHALAAYLPRSSSVPAPLLFIGNDGGLYRSVDGANEAGGACSLTDASHFENLNGSLGSLSEVVSFAQDPVDPGTLLAGLGGLGSAGTGNAAAPWAQLASGEGGTVAIDQSNPLLWYVSTGAGISIARCSKGSGCGLADFATTTLGEADVSNDVAAVHAPWLLDPSSQGTILLGTCREWRGPASNGALWSSSNAASRPFGAAAATGCSATFPVVRSLAAGAPVSGAGSEVLYAGLAGALDGGGGFGGHLFATSSAHLADNTTVWTDLAKSPVTNDFSDGGVFNPGGFDLSSVAADAHDASGATVYATVMGFAANGVNAPHVYRSIDRGGHWTNISSNLPNAPANSLVVDPNDANTVYVALDTGVYVTTSVTSCVSVNCWSVYGIALPNAPVVQLQAAAEMPVGDGRKGELRAATYGRGIWQAPLLTASQVATPAMTLNPAALLFADQQVQTQSAYVTIIVTNTGSAPLLVSSASLSISSVSGLSDFIESDTCVGTTVAPNAACNVLVSFAPSAVGARSGVLTLYGNVPGGQATAALSGTATAPASILLTPLSLMFGATSVGATSGAQSVTISNTAPGPAKLQVPVVSGDFRISANTCGSVLGASTGCTVSVVFAPSGSGARAGTLTVQDDAGMQTASLSGTGANPATDALSMLTLAFQPERLSTSSAVQVLTLNNAGDVPLTLIAASITAGDFSVVNGCGNSLSAHASCTLSVAFVPTSIGAQSGALLVSDQFRGQSVALSGFGLAGPGVSLSPSRDLLFGAVGVNSPSSGQTATLTNNGSVPLLLSSLSANGDFFLVTGANTCGGRGALIAPSAVCTVQVGFAPTATGVRTGTLTVVDDAPNSPQTLRLTGSGVDFSMAAEGPITYTIASGETATFTLLVGAQAGLPGTMAFTCSGMPAHASCVVNPATVNLGDAAGGSVVTVTIATGLADVTAHDADRPIDRRRIDRRRIGGGGIGWGLLFPVGVLAFLRRRWRWFVRKVEGDACVPHRVGRVLGVAMMSATLLCLTACSLTRIMPGDGAPTFAPAGVSPSGTYTLVVAASSANLVRAVNLTLVVR